MPVDELIVNLTKPAAVGSPEVRRVEALVQLIRLVGHDSSRDTTKSSCVHFAAPLGSIEAAELAWYLERYMQWPAGTFRKRAEAVERGFPKWGRALFDAIATDNLSRGLIHDWQTTSGSGRRLTIRIDIGEEGNLGNKSDVDLAQEECSLEKLLLLLELCPWQASRPNTFDISLQRLDVCYDQLAA